MNILVLQETDWVKRGPLQQHHLMERLQRRGHNIRVIDFEVLWRENRSIYSKRRVFRVSRTLGNTEVTVIRPAFLRVPLVVYSSVMLTHTVETLRQIKEFKPDVIVGFDVPNSYIAFELARFFKIPSIYYVIDVNYLFIPEKFLQPIAKVTELKTIKIADAIVTINHMLKSYYVKNMGADPSKTQVISAGIDTQRVNPSISGSRIREKYAIGHDDIVLFFMGWLYTFSGLKEVAASLAKYHGKPDIRLLIVGRGDLRGELLRLKQNGLGDRLVLVDWQPYDEVAKYIAASDVCLLPASNNEVMRYIVPIKMYEYMACGKPVIATKLPGVAMEFGEGNGVLYVNSPEDVLKKAVALSRDKAAMKGIGLKAFQYVQKFSWESIVDQFETMLIKLTKKS